MHLPRLIAFVIKELREALPAIVFFAIGFNLIGLTTQLLLDTYNVQFADYTAATLAALLVGKAVLLAGALPFFRRFDNKPLIQPILFKTFIYWFVVALIRILERVVEYLAGGGELRNIPEFVLVNFSWNRFAAVQLWILVLFLIYATADELNGLMGEGEIARVFFTSGPSQVKLMRRQRIRALVKLTRLIETHALNELRSPQTAAHATMLRLISELAMRQSNGGKDEKYSKSGSA
jgi:hypothetical protein